MASVSKRAPILVLAAIFLALCLIGWVARATLAQDAKQEPTSPLLPATTPAELPGVPQDAAVAPSDAVKAAPLLGPAEMPAKAPAPSATLSESSVVSTGVPSEIQAPAQVLASDPEVRVESAADDPEKSALAFVEQNQKMAESQLKNLKAEEAKLRDRLRKVESGIKRWESLLGALKQSQGSVAVVSPATPGNWKQAEPDEPGPQRLEPLPKSKRIDGKK